MIFDGSHLARTGIVGPGNRTAQNNWRNNFHLQKGVGCYADASELSSPAFLGEPRRACRHLRPVRAGQLRGATCELALASPRYRAEDHQKWLKIYPDGKTVASVDTMLVSNFESWVAAGGRRLPIVPLIVALYHDADPGLATGARALAGVDVADFVADFNLSPNEVGAYFDQDPANRHNAALVGGPWGISYSPFTLAMMAPSPPVSAGRPAGPAVTTPRPRTIPAPVLTATPVAPPVATAWWDAEALVKRALEDDGWTVYDVSRQQLGYDLFAQKRSRTLHVDAKSSSSYCTPTLTAREWRQATTLRDQYVLAIVENFDPTGINNVYWVRDPTITCMSRPRTMTEYAIPRSSWTRATVPSP